MEEATSWVKDKLWSLWAPTPTSCYCKGEFANLIFAKFDSKSDRDTAIEVLKGVKGDSNDVWAKVDQPVKVRAVHSFMFQFKTQVFEWGYGRTEVWVDK